MACGSRFSRTKPRTASIFSCVFAAWESNDEMMDESDETMYLRLSVVRAAPDVRGVGSSAETAGAKFGADVYV